MENKSISCLGIDVGLRHMSHCLLKKNNDEFHIENMDNIDLLENTQYTSCKQMTISQVLDLAMDVVKRIYPIK